MPCLVREVLIIGRENASKESEVHVLVVDDDHAIRRLLMSVLEQGGYAVTGAQSAAEALDLVRRGTRFGGVPSAGLLE